MKPDGEIRMTTKEAARYLEKSDRTVRNLCESGKLSYYQDGERGKITIPYTSVLDYDKSTKKG